MSTDAVDAFVREARAYCSFVETAAQLRPADRLRAARERLLALYSAALSLPSVEPDDSDEEPSPGAPTGWVGFEGNDVYWEVFDPYEHADPVAGSLAGDVLEVYGEVRAGLARWDASRKQSAIWEWRAGFDSHWGDHAIDALRALHRACKWDA